MVSGWQVVQRNVLGKLVELLQIEGELQSWYIMLLFNLFLLIAHYLLQLFVGVFQDSQQRCVSRQEGLEERFGLSFQHLDSLNQSQLSTLMLESGQHSFEGLFGQLFIFDRFEDIRHIKTLEFLH